MFPFPLQTLSLYEVLTVVIQMAVSFAFIALNFGQFLTIFANVTGSSAVKAYLECALKKCWNEAVFVFHVYHPRKFSVFLRVLISFQ
jgi:hypothetical protein